MRESWQAPGFLSDHIAESDRATCHGPVIAFRKRLGNKANCYPFRGGGRPSVAVLEAGQRLGPPLVKAADCGQDQGTLDTSAARLAGLNRTQVA